jgi:putative oxygen-independent coproporphyrinogen III oxidase
MPSWRYSRLMSRPDDIATSGGATNASLYVHVPFCLLKCSYCDFHSTPMSREPGVADHFAWAVGEGAGHWAALGVLDDVESIYIGGGTPTTLGTALVSLVEGLIGTARLASDAEITVETNPDTTDAKLVARLASAGVNRFSLGVQSFDDVVLRTLGRCHSAETAQRAIEDLAVTGAKVAIDLICGVPGQSLDSWTDSIDRAVGSGVGHVSVYPLSLAEGTPLAEAVSSGQMAAPDEDVAAEMMEIAEARFAAGGLRRYEIASYAREGQESAHNTGYWTGRPYVGIGPSAASMLTAETFEAAIACEAWSDPGVAGVGRTLEGVPAGTARVRFVRSADTIAFLRKPVGPPEEVEYLTDPEATAEDAMLGLRLACGITDAVALSAGATDTLADLASRGLVEHSDGRWRMTHAGWLLGNEVFTAVWHAGARRGLV